MTLEFGNVEYSETEKKELLLAFEKMPSNKQVAFEWVFKELQIVHADIKTIQAAMVINSPELQELFPQCRDTVENIVRLEKAVRMKGQLEEKAKAVQKILTSMATDLRILIVASLMTCYELMHINWKEAQEADREKAKDALDIFSPLLHKLGMGRLKNQLEDHALRVLDAKAYQHIVKQLDETKKERENYLQRIQHALEKELSSIPNTVISGRVKHIYSIWKKTQKSNHDLTSIRDLTALRVKVDNVPQCYEALGHVHSLFPPIPGSFKDYIAKPKPNGYQSLHTTVMGPDEKLIEIQIRTQEMHQYNELGVAAHFRYKGHTDTSKLDKRLLWLREAFQFSETEEGRQTLESVTSDFFENEIFVFTPKGKVVELEEGSTPIDFAYAIHSDVGNHCVGAKVNGKQVPLDYRLQNADQVEVTTSEKQVPKRQWLLIVKTAKAKAKIRTFLQFEQSKIKPADTQKVIKPAPIKSIEITGHDQKELRFAKCCRPVPGDEIQGFLTTKRKITVHRKDCLNAQRNEQAFKLIHVEWNVKSKGLFNVAIRVLAQDQPALLTELLTIFSQRGAKVSAARAKNSNQLTECYFELEIKDLTQLQPIMETLSKHKWVKMVERA